MQACAAVLWLTEKFFDHGWYTTAKSFNPLHSFDRATSSSTAVNSRSILLHLRANRQVKFTFFRKFTQLSAYCRLTSFSLQTWLCMCYPASKSIRWNGVFYTRQVYLLAVLRFLHLVSIRYWQMSYCLVKMVWRDRVNVAHERKAKNINCVLSKL